jgi:putative hemolysin
VSILIVEIFLFLVLLFLSGFFSGSETALFSLSRIQVERLIVANERRGRQVERLIERPRRLIISILLGNQLVNISLTSIAAALIIQLIDQDVPWINIVIVLPILLLVGEITPKTIAIRRNEQFSLFVAAPLTLFTKIVTPVRWFIRTISDRLANLFIRENSRTPSILNEDVIKTIVNEGEKEGIIAALEKDYIYRIFDFGDAHVDDVMTPRVNMFYLPVEMPLTEMIGKIKEEHYSKVPIYHGNRDNIIGILFATDLIGLDATNIEQSGKILQRILRKPYFIPITKRADELFQTFQRRKISIAIVLDEYGGVQGMVTMEDLLETIFGDIGDEYEEDDVHYERLSDNLFRIKANMSLDEFNELMGADLVSDEVDTIGGFVFSLFGELPQLKNSIDYLNMNFTVEKITFNRIESLIVKRL